MTIVGVNVKATATNHGLTLATLVYMTAAKILLAIGTRKASRQATNQAESRIILHE
jgi:hypothetical protein